MHSGVKQLLIMGLTAGMIFGLGCNRNEPPPAPVAPPDSGNASAVESTPQPIVPGVQPTPEPEVPPVHMSDVQPTATQPATTPSTQPIESSPPTDPKLVPPHPDPKVALFGGLTGPKPATWVWQPANRMSVICEYIVPGRDGLNQGRVTIFRVGGSPEQNILRWKTQQFRGPNQTAVEPKLSQLESDGMAITLAEFVGEFKGTGAVNFSPDHTLLAAIIPDAPGGQIIVYFVGPTGTVEPNREAYMEMIRNLKKVDAQK